MGEKNAEPIISRFFGVFFMCACSAPIWGNLVVSAGKLFAHSNQTLFNFVSIQFFPMLAETTIRLSSKRARTNWNCAEPIIASIQQQEIMARPKTIRPFLAMSSLKRKSKCFLASCWAFLFWPLLSLRSSSILQSSNNFIKSSSNWHKI